MAGLVERADQVVVARVSAQQARWDGDQIVTDVLLEVEDAVHGSASTGDTLMLVRLGGAIDDLGMRVEGEPSFNDGNRYLVFLREWRGMYRPVGMSQGVMRVQEQADGTRIVEPGGAGLSLVTRPGGPPALGALWRPRTLSSVRDQIRRLAREP
ncbi:MAG: hypothetical protein AAGE52_01960 [Myxococcota bacterium]